MTEIRQRGFTLIEILIVLAIIGILAAIAVPAYQDSVQKSRRTDGMTAALEGAALQERWYFQQNQYTSDVDNLATATSPEGYYSISVLQPCGSSACFTMQAEAVGTQLEDVDCRKFLVTHTGIKSSEDSGGNDSTAECWK